MEKEKGTGSKIELPIIEPQAEAKENSTIAKAKKETDPIKIANILLKGALSDAYFINDLKQAERQKEQARNQIPDSRYGPARNQVLGAVAYQAQHQELLSSNQSYGTLHETLDNIQNNLDDTQQKPSEETELQIAKDGLDNISYFVNAQLDFEDQGGQELSTTHQESEQDAFTARDKIEQAIEKLNPKEEKVKQAPSQQRPAVLQQSPESPKSPKS